MNSGAKTMELFNNIPGEWREAIIASYDGNFAEEFGRLCDFIDSEYDSFPDDMRPVEKTDVFNALSVPFGDVKAVILGQDPYPDAEKAHGLAFDTADGSVSASLRNVFYEIEREKNPDTEQKGFKTERTGDLSGWTRQGVLLLNTILTFKKKSGTTGVNAHAGIGWEKFTDAIISALDGREHPPVFLLWGKPAEKKTSLLKKTPADRILATSHPSPLSARRGFIGSGIFKKANDALGDGNEIEW